MNQWSLPILSELTSKDAEKFRGGGEHEGPEQLWCSQQLLALGACAGRPEPSPGVAPIALTGAQPCHSSSSKGLLFTSFSQRQQQGSSSCSPGAHGAEKGNLSARWQSLRVSALSHLRDYKEVSTNLFSHIVPAAPWPRAGPWSCCVPAVPSTDLQLLCSPGAAPAPSFSSLSFCLPWLQN